MHLRKCVFSNKQTVVVGNRLDGFSWTVFQFLFCVILNFGHTAHSWHSPAVFTVTLFACYGAVEHPVSDVTLYSTI